MRDIERELKRNESISFFRHVCEMTRTDFDESAWAYNNISDECHIAISNRTHYRNGEEFHNIHMTLVYKTLVYKGNKTYTEPINSFSNAQSITFETIKIGASDRVIMNRFNKLVELAKSL